MKLSRHYHNDTAKASTPSYDEYLAMCKEYGHKPQSSRDDFSDYHATKAKGSYLSKAGKVGQ